jgi:transcriptional regulator with XRE-family HTH domain
MLNMGNISNPIRIVHLRESQGEYTGGIVSLPFPTVSSVTGTSEDACSPDEAQHALNRDMFGYQLLARATGAELRDCSSLLRIVVYEVTSDIVLTSYQTVRLLPQEAPQVRQISHSKQEVPAEVYSQPMQARRLREISGLTVEQLADIFGVSRTTYHKWMDNSSLSERHKQHLLEVFPLIEYALQRLGSTSALNTWLLTPVTAGGKKPIEYLSSRQYNTFRGFLLHQGNDQNLLRPPIPLKYPYLERPREEVEDELERLNPSFLLDEDYSDASDRNE